VSGNCKGRPFITKWLEELQLLYDNNREELLALDLEQRSKRLAEMNIRAQIINLSKLEVIQKAWERQAHPVLFGWYFDLNTGVLTEVFSMERNENLKQVTTIVPTS
jgi:carbonic anhydrase